ncbi:magnesium-translocating P-type ATPase [Nitrosomonas sp.]|uniref:magnesium-translocating P-type ATPase n=1 Tax=Nitrosomonas sp. TaxID=42353 RepID=UPI00260289A5|nr:magnesium-translocating P-type ATPase [Nitrosomonas sp.]MCW5600811.1 magnesium-translocating P-type ATPase [Nitrosomonas sp.]
MIKRIEPDAPWWAVSVEQVAQDIGSSPNGLSGVEATTRLQRYGTNTLRDKDDSGVTRLLLRQLSSPIVLILIAAAILSFIMHDATDGLIILFIVIVSGLLGFWQEYRAASVMASLQQLVAVQAEVLRDGVICKISLEDIVPGDVAILSAGSNVPADCRLLEARDLFVNEATLTGESFPIEKMPGDLPADTPLARRSNILFQGTHVVSGIGRALVLRTGLDTQFGEIAEQLRIRPEETNFERGVRQFGMLLIRVTLILVILIFAFNVYLQRPVLDSFLFALALAVGLTPELLPAIISVNLASGARRMAARKVIVKRLVSIENFGSMDVLCSDKTGTLTEGKVRLDGALDVEGRPSERTLQLAGINAAFQTGFTNPIDEAIVAAAGEMSASVTRLDEIPYDFARKRLSVLAMTDAQTLLITKGALAQVLSVCTQVAMGNGEIVPIGGHQQVIQERFAAFSAHGLRTLGLAMKAMPGRTTVARNDEAGMTFVGFLLFGDPPRPGIAATIEELRGLGVALKIITGDNLLVAQAVARQIGLSGVKIVSGQALRQVGDDALPQLAHDTDIFAEIEPNQKESIIRALRKAGHVVGYMGDGINDAPALHAADVGLSVQGAADVAKEAADIVLLEPDLAVLAAGVREGRSTFANTQKYVFMATSANFGNMFSMAGASLLLPFLPLLPKQILLTNLLTDLPEMTIATDRVDAEAIQRPQRWDIKFIRSFMLRFGLLSSVFDFITFGTLFFILNASPELFRTGWFVESVVSASLVVLVLRTRGPFWRSRSSRALALATLIVVVATILLPYTPLGSMFGLVPLPPVFLAITGVIVAMYISSAERLKRAFYRQISR